MVEQMMRTDLIYIYHSLIQSLKEERNNDGFWNGHLSSSALATAVAIVALKINGSEIHKDAVSRGLEWLMNHTNSDGGFGDTPESRSNVSTSLLCYAAISCCADLHKDSERVLAKLGEYLLTQQIDLSKGDITSSVLAFYGNDFTFSVPILSMLIICGVLDNKEAAKIPQLPFEFTLFPSSWYSFFNLRVVSYAIPALIAVGIFIFKRRTRHNILMKWIRNRSITPALRKLEQIVPASGGFLEAIPLTAFVVMCLRASDLQTDGVEEKGITFLRHQQRSDGSWPIDTDLSTWVTTLGVKALGKNINIEFTPVEVKCLINHLKSTQYQSIHPFNGAKPGGWGWTNQSGAVPDVDDTAGAILALCELAHSGNAEAIINGCSWLITIQNSDGGFPTFCKGWGRLPFDSSCADLAGHALLALTKSLDHCQGKMPPKLRKKIIRSINRSVEYLKKCQLSDGSWCPLWFGNQFTKKNKNPVYGTAKVAIYLSDSLKSTSLNQPLKNQIKAILKKGQNYLQNQQNNDGSWGGEKGISGTIEESALAISALVETDSQACLRGFEWIEKKRQKRGLHASPIGLYFAKLWYDERLYPTIYYLEALRRFIHK